MKILVVGTGGVGSAFAAIARRRSFFDHCALADYDPARPQAVVAAARTTAASRAHRVDASSQDAVVELIRETRARRRPQRRRPALQRADLRRCLEAGVTYLDMAMTLSEPHPEHPFEQTGVKLGDYQFERAAAWEEAGLLALVGIGIEPGAADVFARHAADELFSEIDEVGDPRRRQPRRRGLRLRADVLDLDDDRGVPQPAGDLGAGPRLVHDGAVLRAGGVRLPGGDRAGRVRQRRARGGAARAALGRLQARDVQVRPRRRVHRRAADAAQARARLEGEDPRQGRRGRAARRRRGGAARPGDARRPDDRQDVRRHARHGHGQGRPAAEDLPLPRRRQRVVDARVRLAGGRLADGAQPRRRARAARRRAPGRASACSAPRRSRPQPFLDMLAELGSPHGVLELAV